MNHDDTTTIGQNPFTARSTASVPMAYPPHPPLQSGGWYRGTEVELPGPGRPPVMQSTGILASSTCVTVTVFTLLALLLLL